jgi:galactokinase
VLVADRQVGARFGSVIVLTTKDGQEQVDEEVSAATTLKEDTERREHDGADDLDDVAGVVC